MTEPVPFGGPSAATFEPVGGAVLVRPHPLETVRASGLFLSQAATDESLGRVFYGTAIKVGPGDRTKNGAPIPPPCDEGDEVVCRMGFGDEIQLLEGPHWVVQRGPLEHGHGVIARWKPAHRHCWHEATAEGSNALARCCGADCPRPVVDTRADFDALFGPQPTCLLSGARLLESARGVTIQKIEAHPAGPNLAKYEAEDADRAAWKAKRES